jgi:hypothetical protein
VRVALARVSCRYHQACRTNPKRRAKPVSVDPAASRHLQSLDCAPHHRKAAAILPPTPPTTLSENAYNLVAAKDLKATTERRYQVTTILSTCRSAIAIDSNGCAHLAALYTLPLPAWRLRIYSAYWYITAPPPKCRTDGAGATCSAATPKTPRIPRRMPSSNCGEHRTCCRSERSTYRTRWKSKMR